MHICVAHRLTVKQLLKEAPYLYHVSWFVAANFPPNFNPLTRCCQIRRAYQEIPFPSYHPDNTIFNDTSFHHFSEESLEGVDETVWEDCPEPTVNTLDPEIII